MAHLPVGWTVSNKDGARAGPARRSSVDDSASEDDDGVQGLDIAPDSPGWEDVEADDDDEGLSVKCLLCLSVFPNVKGMVAHCAAEHNFDLLAVIKRHGLDFYGTIQLVNYVRSRAKEGVRDVDVSEKGSWEDEKFLQPVLEEDALLFSLDELVEEVEGEEDGKGKVADWDEAEALRRAREQRSELEDVAE